MLYRLRFSIQRNPGVNSFNLPSGIPGTVPVSDSPGNAFTVLRAKTMALSLFPGWDTVITPALFKTDAMIATATAGSSSATVTGSVVAS
jgi:hypothetical protein